MALIKTPDGGFYVDDTQISVDYVKNSISVIGGGSGGGSGPDGDYITTDGGMFNADATLTGTDELTIEVPDAGESATVGITPQGVTLVHNTNDSADARIRVIQNSIEILANGTTVQLNGTGVNFGGGTITNVSSIGGTSAREIGFENTLDMNNHQIKAVSDPTEAQDVATKNYVDSNFATQASISDFITISDIPDASASAKGLVNQGVAVANSSGATDTTLETVVNNLLASLRNAGIIASS